MKLRSNVELRRARPLLGTIVDLSCAGQDVDLARAGIDAAFAAIAKVHRLMSFHDPASDVSRINRAAFHKPVKVHPWTWRVLKSAQRFSRQSDGVFDTTIARMLMKWSYLPPLHPNAGAGDWRDIILETECVVRFRRRLLVDLGGIAKGFAVDRAVDVLKQNGVAAGIVNAGGDLRVFGSASQLIHLRHPTEPMRAAGAVRLRERAMATSGIYFAERSDGGARVSPLLNGRTGRSSRKSISVTVAADECMTADALTKIVFALGEKAAPLLERYGADALLLERDGAPCWMFHPPCGANDRNQSD